MPDPHHRPALSIVVPFYNVASYLQECLVSLRDQLLDDVEIILVDDGSPDGSLAIAERFAAADPRFRIVRQDNQGLGPARNTGAAHARGTYLTFVDSDDIVAPRAYTLMVGSLEESGSQFAAGNAYRFGDGKGVRQSWTHRHAFRKTLIGTSIAEYPGLMADRMVWNKVYRRSFWDERGFEFPAIRYEDYPITLRGYLEAESVDILHDHVYFWRIRTSGDSITQQAARVDNAHDRFTSAIMTLDILEKYPERADVRERIQSYFAHIDLVALAESMVCVDATDRPLLEHMVRQLAHRLDPAASKNTSRLARLLHRAVLAGDMQLAANLARWRLDGDTRTLARQLTQIRQPLLAPRAVKAVLPRRKVSNPFAMRKLRSQLVDARWEGTTLVLQIETRLRAELACRVRASVTCLGPLGPVALPVQARPLRGGGLSLEVRVDTGEIDLGDGKHQSERATGEPGLAHLRIDLRLGPLRWSGRARFTPDLLPGLRPVPGDCWLQPRGVGWYVGLQQLARPVVIDRVTIDGNRFVLEPGESARGVTLVLRRPDPSADVLIPLGDGPVTVPAADLIAGDPADNVVTGRAERPLVVVRPKAAQDEDGVLIDVDEPVYLADLSAALDVDGTNVGLERGWYGALVVRQAPVEAEVLESETIEAGQPAASDAAPEVDGQVPDVQPGEGVEPGTERTL